MDTAAEDAGCTCDGGSTQPLPNTHPAPGPIATQAMTACKASPLIQKIIA